MYFVSVVGADLGFEFFARLTNESPALFVPFRFSDTGPRLRLSLELESVVSASRSPPQCTLLDDDLGSDWLESRRCRGRGRGVFEGESELESMDKSFEAGTEGGLRCCLSMVARER